MVVVKAQFGFQSGISETVEWYLLTGLRVVLLVGLGLLKDVGFAVGVCFAKLLVLTFALVVVWFLDIAIGADSSRSTVSALIVVEGNRVLVVFIPCVDSAVTFRRGASVVNPIETVLKSLELVGLLSFELLIGPAVVDSNVNGAKVGTDI